MSQPKKLPPGLPEGYEFPPDWVPNPDGQSNLELDNVSFQLAPPDSQLADHGEGGMTDDEAVAFLSRPVAEFRNRRGQR